MRYRRARVKGGTFFFTIVALNREEIFSNKKEVDILREAFKHVSIKRPFVIDATVILPDHIHSIWTLPDGDNNFSVRWQLIKALFTIRYNKSKVGFGKKHKQKVWQPRFWEHQIRDERDFAAHVDYIHYNPVKHGYVKGPRDWEHSSFHKYVKDGLYDLSWGVSDEIMFQDQVGNE